VACGQIVTEKIEKRREERETVNQIKKKSFLCLRAEHACVHTRREVAARKKKRRGEMLQKAVCLSCNTKSV
jgi:hypothetical protein